MKLVRLLTLLLFPFSLIASAHNFVDGQRVKPVQISDQGELVLDSDAIHYKNWSTSEFKGKVRIVQYIAGRRSAKKKTHC